VQGQVVRVVRGHEVDWRDGNLDDHLLMFHLQPLGLAAWRLESLISRLQRRTHCAWADDATTLAVRPDLHADSVQAITVHAKTVIRLHALVKHTPEWSWA
jgi:hypothetical protein